MEIIGYHGTTLESAQDILNHGIDCSKVIKEWVNDFGNGFYTYIDIKDAGFDNNPKQNALEYARTFKSQNDNKPITVLKLTCSIDEDKILYLIDREVFLAIGRLFNKMKKATYDTIPNYLKREYNSNFVKEHNKKKLSGAAKRNNRDGFSFEYAIKNRLISEPQVIIEETHTDFSHIRSRFPNGIEMAIRDISVIKQISLIS